MIGIIISLILIIIFVPVLLLRSVITNGKVFWIISALFYILVITNIVLMFLGVY